MRQATVAGEFLSHNHGVSARAAPNKSDHRGKSDHPDPIGRSRPISAIAVEEQLAQTHQAALRIRGVLHLLHEVLQSGNGINARRAPAVSALIEAAENDLATIDKAIDALIDAHLGRDRP